LKFKKWQFYCHFFHFFVIFSKFFKFLKKMTFFHVFSLFHFLVIFSDFFFVLKKFGLLVSRFFVFFRWKHFFFKKGHFKSWSGPKFDISKSNWNRVFGILGFSWFWWFCFLKNVFFVVRNKPLRFFFEKSDFFDFFHFFHFFHFFWKKRDFCWIYWFL